ncbi:MAG: hypothetical protein IJU53_02895 [Thermoguttaceae bacterium]|nr:hypothetical protein [Thermoguttaceae bacterium]
MKFICKECGYIHEGPEAPEKCPVCGVGKEMFDVMPETTATTATEGGCSKLNLPEFVSVHKIGDGKVEDAEVTAGLKAHFAGECAEVGMYLAMSRQADREVYPEIAEAYKRRAFEEAEHAAKFAELLGEVVSACSKSHLQLRVVAETGDCAAKFVIAMRA